MWNERRNAEEEKPHGRRKMILAAVAAASVATVAFAGITIVPSGDVGVTTTAG